MTFQIRRFKAPPNYGVIKTSTPKGATAPVVQTSDVRKQILDRQVSSCWFKPGARVKFKKPKRNPIYATVVDIITDHNVCKWSNTGAPMNIVIEVEKKDKDTNIVYGSERMFTNVKKLVYCGKA